MYPKFRGSEIATEIVKAVEALPAEAEIVTLKAGENMLITCAYITENYYVAGDGLITEYAWNGESWHDIGYL